MDSHVSSYLKGMPMLGPVSVRCLFSTNINKQTSHPPIHKWGEYNILKFHTLSKPVWGEDELHENNKVLEVTGICDNYLFCFPPPAVFFVLTSIIPDFEKSEDGQYDTFSVAYLRILFLQRAEDVLMTIYIIY